MPIYDFKARTSDGELVKGAMDAAAESLVLRELESRGVYPVEVKESGRRTGLLGGLFKRKRLRLDDRILFVRQFEAMLRAGLPITTTLSALSSQSNDPLLSGILTTVRKDIEGGSTLAQALRKHPGLLSSIQVSLIDAGEQGGILDEILERIGELLEYDAETRARIRAATFYPTIVIVELLLAFVVIIRFVFPRFKALFSSRGADLPLPTRIMIAVSDFTGQYWWHIIGGAIVLAAAFYWWSRTDRGRRQIDAVTIKVPIFGELVLMILMSRFSRVTSSLLESGIPFLRSLSIVEKTIDNKIIQEEIAHMGQEIQKGQSIAESIRAGGCFPQPVTKMLEVGEKSGKISPMLLRISNFYDRQVDYKIKTLTTVLEPILLVVLGVSVLFMALAVFLPMWDMSRVITGR